MKKLTSIFLFPLLMAFIFSSCGNRKPENKNENKYKLVWQDEFDYTGLPDSTKWSYDTAGNKSGWGNHELEYYTYGRKENAWVDSGSLKIRAIRENYNGRNYTSARLVTRHKGDWLYGKVEVRAKLPTGRGTWPAIWMLPTDWEYGGWPESGEIDIMELVGFMPDSVFASIHAQSANKTEGIYIDDTGNNYHVYGMEWQQDTINMLLDGKKYFTYVNNKSGFKAWPFDKRFHLLLNIAVGGDWGGQKGVDDSSLPYEMDVDYVRVYQR